MAMSCPTLMNSGPSDSMVSRVQAASFRVRALFLHGRHLSAPQPSGPVSALESRLAGMGTATEHCKCHMIV